MPAVTTWSPIRLTPSSPNETVSTVPPWPGPANASQDVASRSMAPSPIPSVPVLDSPSVSARRRSAIPGPASIATSSTPAAAPFRQARTSRLPPPACFTWLPASSVATIPISPTRVSSNPSRSASAIAARRTTPTVLSCSTRIQATSSTTVTRVIAAAPTAGSTGPFDDLDPGSPADLAAQGEGVHQPAGTGQPEAETGAAGVAVGEGQVDIGDPGT